MSAPRCIKGCGDMPTPLCTSSPHRMSLTHFLLLLLSWPFHQAVLGHPSALHKRDNSRNVPSLGFYDPHSNGGSWLTVRLRLRAYASPNLIFLPIIRQLRIQQIFPSFFGFLESQQHLPCWPWRTDQRRYPWDIRPRGSG